MPNTSERPKVGVVVLVVKDGKILLGKRLGDAMTPGMYGAPGGHMELGETMEECARREVQEEVGLEIENIRPLSVANVRREGSGHYVMLLFTADWKSGEVKNCEPDRCEGWDWYDPQNPPEPLTPATNAVIQAYLAQDGKFFETDKHRPIYQL